VGNALEPSDWRRRARLDEDFPRFRYQRSKDSMHLGQSRSSRGTDSGNSFSSASAKALSAIGVPQRLQMGIASLILIGDPQLLTREVIIINFHQCNHTT
jgi:hypothetical protein